MSLYWLKKAKGISVILACLFYSVSFAQDTVYVNGKPKIYKDGTSYNEGESPLKKDDYLIEASFGYPFVPLKEASVFGLDLFTGTKSKRTLQNSNHICLRADYQLNTDFSVGLEFTYAHQSFEYYRSYTQYINNIAVTTDSLFDAKATKIRFLAKVGYHFNISDRFDAYGTAGFGIKQFNYSTRDYYLTTSNLVNEIMPIAIRASLGGRFFVSKDLAIHVEGGIGGPMMQVGLTYKMHSNYDPKASEEPKKRKGK